MKKKCYIKPKIEIEQVNTKTILTTSGFETQSRNYRSGGDDTWDIENN